MVRTLSYICLLDTDVAWCVHYHTARLLARHGCGMVCTFIFLLARLGRGMVRTVPYLSARHERDMIRTVISVC